MCNKIYSDLLILYCIMSHVSMNISIAHKAISVLVYF